MKISMLGDYLRVAVPQASFLGPFILPHIKILPVQILFLSGSLRVPHRLIGRRKQH